MIKRTFTIVELLVAMALTFVVIMALSTIYVRISKFALEQAGSASSYSGTSTALDKISNDMRNIYLPGTYPGGIPSGVVPSSPGRLLSALAPRATVSAGNNFTPIALASTTSSTTGWPYFGFTATPSGNYSLGTGSSNVAVAYFCGPSVLDTTTTNGRISNNLLTLYRLANARPSGAYFMTTFSTNTNIIISNKVIYMATVAHQGYVSATNNRATRTLFDTSSDSFSNSFDCTPDDVDVLLTMVPDSGYLEFNISGSVTASTTFSNYQQSGAAGAAITSSAITKMSAFSWDPEGFFANLTTGAVFYYRSNTTGIDIWSIPASGSSTISATDTLITGTTTKRRIQIK